VLAEGGRPAVLGLVSGDLDGVADQPVSARRGDQVPRLQQSFRQVQNGPGWYPEGP
jgi:hypothetical protein